MMPRAVIFDLDGTLIDTIEDILHSANQMFRKHGFPEHTREEFVRWIGNGAVKLIERGLGVPVEKEELLAYVDDFKEIYHTHYAVKSRIYAGIEDILDTLQAQNVKMAILSNKPHGLTVQVAESYLSKWDISPVFGQRDEVPKKPDPAGVFEIAEMLGVEPSETLFVGDSEGDIRTALSAGMQPVGVSWGYGNVDLAREHGAPVIDQPLEFLKLLR